MTQLQVHQQNAECTAHKRRSACFCVVGASALGSRSACCLIEQPLMSYEQTVENYVFIKLSLCVIRYQMSCEKCACSSQPRPSCAAQSIGHVHVHTCMYMRMYAVFVSMIGQHTKIFKDFVLIGTNIHIIEIIISCSIILWKLHSILV